MKEQMGNINKKMEILRESQKEKLKIESTVREMKNPCVGWTQLKEESLG
jgi:hypothetical protein